MSTPSVLTPLAAPVGGAPAAGPGPGAPVVDVVVPTIGRPSLVPLLDRLVADRPSPTGGIVVVDDRRSRTTPLSVPDGVVVVPGGGRGPAAARNAGWRAARGDWVAFLDDDVLPEPGWSAALRSDLAAAGPLDDNRLALRVSQGRVRVPLPGDRRPTDTERNVARLEGAPWITADLAVPRALLALVGGFDEGFPRAYREDTDLALRLGAAGVRRLWGQRTAVHPPGPAPWWVSIARQRGNADDARLRRLHGADWRARAGVARGRFRRHVVTVGCGAVALVAARAGRRRLAAVAGGAWVLGTGELAWSRCRGGPRNAREVLAMAATDAVLPVAAVLWRSAGELAVRRRCDPAPRAVLFDRDGTLVDDVPYNGDPDRVRLRPGAAQSVARARQAGLAVGLVTNQSGIGRGLLTLEAVDAVNERVGALVGGFDVVVVCPHGPDDGCGCRKPAPGLLSAAAAHLGFDPAHCWIVGDIGADVAAAHSAGARAVLVPTSVTRVEEVRLAPVTAPDLATALDLILGERRVGIRGRPR